MATPDLPNKPKRGLNPNHKPSDWIHHTAFERAQVARIFLYVHGFLSDGENDRVKQRIAKWASAFHAPEREAKSNA